MILQKDYQLFHKIRKQSKAITLKKKNQSAEHKVFFFIKTKTKENELTRTKMSST